MQSSDEAREDPLAEREEYTLARARRDPPLQSGGVAYNLKCRVDEVRSQGQARRLSLRKPRREVRIPARREDACPYV